jgi:hypothetical protein
MARAPETRVGNGRGEVKQTRPPARPARRIPLSFSFSFSFSLSFSFSFSLSFSRSRKEFGIGGIRFEAEAAKVVLTRCDLRGGANLGTLGTAGDWFHWPAS